MSSLRASTRILAPRRAQAIGVTPRPMSRRSTPVSTLSGDARVAVGGFDEKAFTERNCHEMLASRALPYGTIVERASGGDLISVRAGSHKETVLKIPNASSLFRMAHAW